MRTSAGRIRVGDMHMMFPAMIARLLGHTQIQTPARYGHLAQQSVKTAADTVADSLADDVGRRPRALLTPE